MTIHLREVPVATLREALQYCPDSGAFTWRKRPVDHFQATSKRTAEHTARIVNATYAGKEAGSLTSEGYRVISVCKIVVLAHRVAFAIMTGEWPRYEIDHENGDQSDNRWVNIREVSRGENARNLCLRRDNRSGVVGVGWYAPRNKWRARITIGNKTVALGLYDSFDDACVARERAQANLGFHKNHGRHAA